jgi:hypothetical protein
MPLLELQGSLLREQLIEVLAGATERLSCRLSLAT